MIERRVDSFTTRYEDTGAANDWLAVTEPWEARMGGDKLFVWSYHEAGDNSRSRREALAAWKEPFGRRVRLGRAAGAQSLYAYRGRNVRRHRRSACGWL